MFDLPADGCPNGGDFSPSLDVTNRVKSGNLFISVFDLGAQNVTIILEG
jgi:hypothetical protein